MLQKQKVQNVVSYLCVALGSDAGEERWESLRTSRTLPLMAVCYCNRRSGQLELDLPPAFNASPAVDFSFSP